MTNGIYPDRRSEFCRRIGAPCLATVPEYRLWIDMRRRCENQSREHYERYGGRGVRVCERWQIFENFYNDMGPRPSAQHTIDRKNVDGNYEPGNCRWALPTIQANNRSNNRLVNYRGETMTLRNALRAAGDVVRKDTARRRLEIGWPVERAVETPPDHKQQRRALKRKKPHASTAYSDTRTKEQKKADREKASQAAREKPRFGLPQHVLDHDEAGEVV